MTDIAQAQFEIFTHHPTLPAFLKARELQYRCSDQLERGVWTYQCNNTVNKSIPGRRFVYESLSYAPEHYGDDLATHFTSVPHECEVGIVVITHDVELATRLPRRVELRDGRIVADTNTATTTDAGTEAVEHA